MLIVHANDTELATIKDEIYAGLQDIVSPKDIEKVFSPVIEKAFKRGAEMWRKKHLPDILGKELAADYDRMIRKTSIGQN